MTNTKNTPMAKVDPNTYNSVVSHATLRDIRLVGTKFDLKPAAINIADHKWTFNISEQLEDWSCDNEKGTLTGIFSYSASCIEGRRKLLNVSTRYMCSYRLSDLCDDNTAYHFLKRVGRFAAYPYFRAIFSTLTQQSGIILPPLPVISDGPRWVNSPNDIKSRTQKDD